MEEYKTLCFKTKKQAMKNESEIKAYFDNRLINSHIYEGTDERGNNGFYVRYNLSR